MSVYDGKHRNLIEKLKQARIEANLSQEELASKLSKTQSYISKLENGQIKVDAILLAELSQLYGKSVNYFLEEKNESHR